MAGEKTKSVIIAAKLRYFASLALPILTLAYVTTYFAIQDKFSLIFLFVSTMVTFLSMLMESQEGWERTTGGKVFLWAGAAISLGIGLYFFDQHLDLVLLPTP